MFLAFYYYNVSVFFRYEDDDMYYRIQKAGLPLKWPPPENGTFFLLEHQDNGKSGSWHRWNFARYTYIYPAVSVDLLATINTHVATNLSLTLLCIQQPGLVLALWKKSAHTVGGWSYKFKIWTDISLIWRKVWRLYSHYLWAQNSSAWKSGNHWMFNFERQAA